MPKLLLSACLVFIVTMILHASFAPFHETGAWRLISPVLSAALAVTAVLFILRKQWTWQYMLWFSVFGVLINAVFFPTREFYGSFLLFAKILAVLEIGACMVILWSILRDQSSKSWFQSSDYPEANK